MRKIICGVLLVLFAMICRGPAEAVEYYGVPMYCRAEIEHRDKDEVVRRITADMEGEGYELKQQSAISLVFETPLRRPNRFNYATDFGLSWFPKNRYGWRRTEFFPPVYRLDVRVLKKPANAVEVIITPVIVWDPGSPNQEEIYEYYFKTLRALNEYLDSLRL